MKNSIVSKDEITKVLDYIFKEAENYLKDVDSLPAIPREPERVVQQFDQHLREEGIGGMNSLRELVTEGIKASIASVGPKCYHFVTGGVTPAAMGAELWASLTDQSSYAWASSPIGSYLEKISISWLKELFRLPEAWGGVMVTGATMANFTCLSAAKQWWGEQQGVDIAEEGLYGLSKIPVFSSGFIHASAIKCLNMTGIGSSSLKILSNHCSGKLDVEALEKELKKLDGAPCIIIGNAGEVNAGYFDPIEKLADLSEKYNAWLHLDGAFGLFARISDRTSHLLEGLERSQSITVDGHKWLNVPYDSGFCFINDPNLMARSFKYSADYLPKEDDPYPNWGSLGPESSRRSRSFAVWATLRAYGKEGCREIVENCLDLTNSMAERVQAEKDLELLADVPLNIVCFRFNPGDRSEEQLNNLNDQLGKAIFEDGRVYAGTTRFCGKTALRPAIVNWRTTEKEIELFVDVVLELAEGL